MADSSALTIVHWSGWIVSAVIAIGGMALTSLGWVVRGRQARTVACRQDIHRTIDLTLESLDKLEDQSISFWLEAKSTVPRVAIIAQIKRLTGHLNQLKRLRMAEQFPTQAISAIRQTATLDFETEVRPISGESKRIQKLLFHTQKLRDHALLQKDWSV